MAGRLQSRRWWGPHHVGRPSPHTCSSSSWALSHCSSLQGGRCGCARQRRPQQEARCTGGSRKQAALPAHRRISHLQRQRQEKEEQQHRRQQGQQRHLQQQTQRQQQEQQGTRAQRPQRPGSHRRHRASSTTSARAQWTSSHTLMPSTSCAAMMPNRCIMAGAASIYVPCLSQLWGQDRLLRLPTPRL